MEIAQITEHTIVNFDFEYMRQTLAALVPVALTVIFHGLGMDLVRRFYKRFGRPALKSPHVTLRTTVLIGIVLLMLMTHFFGICLWAAFYFLTNMMPNFKHAMFFSMNSYTTIGASNLVLPPQWLGFSSFEAMTGMLMFGWSTAMLASIIDKFHSIDD